MRFRKSTTLFPGVKINWSKSGASLSVGRPGATLNFSAKGTRATVGIPGTGLSQTVKLSGPTKATATHAETRRGPAAHVEVTPKPMLPPKPKRTGRAWLALVALVVDIAVVALPLLAIGLGVMVPDHRPGAAAYDPLAMRAAGAFIVALAFAAAGGGSWALRKPLAERKALSFQLEAETAPE